MSEFELQRIPELDELSISQNGDFLLIHQITTDTTFKITKANFLAGFINSLSDYYNKQEVESLVTGFINDLLNASSTKTWSINKIKSFIEAELDSLQMSNELDLMVTTDGQTVFNVFQNITNSNLNINGADYYQNHYYTISFNAPNWQLVWNNQFELETTDKIKLKY
jgi:hypothetical protein